MKMSGDDKVILDWDIWGVGAGKEEGSTWGLPPRHINLYRAICLKTVFWSCILETYNVGYIATSKTLRVINAFHCFGFYHYNNCYHYQDDHDDVICGGQRLKWRRTGNCSKGGKFDQGCSPRSGKL